ncbi:glycosyl transferase family 2 [Paenibacillus selenitireducens]|uniref:4,4'-diaponeurosporenoate glycosyltransferase n=1 Tax=Paenibacillus selenitireducens TaxID=1324314 RepID=A0A1T2X0U1_9BACL|nr:glycosyltransferase [Paenibacillus selenitireducens]OPA73528.1 glycosyl transferase family 2 [Paenibacillus selenitireducens]
MTDTTFARSNPQVPVKFSILIPAHNEEHYIPKCLQSIATAALPFPNQVEVIVILNRCTDRTEEIARSFGCITLKNDSKNLSKIRNAGAQIANGEYLVTIDADSQMTDLMLVEIDRHLSLGTYIGGGVAGKFERVSLGIIVSAILLIVPLLIKYGAVSVGIFWCRKIDFDAIGGFNERMLMAEDADFAHRLKKWGKQQHKKYGTIKKAQMITSCRKFDKYGDWGVVKKPSIIWAYLKGTDRTYADETYYEDQGR